MNKLTSCCVSQIFSGQDQVRQAADGTKRIGLGEEEGARNEEAWAVEQLLIAENEAIVDWRPAQEKLDAELHDVEARKISVSREEDDKIAIALRTHSMLSSAMELTVIDAERRRYRSVG
jgi:hypothetical protein